MRRILIFLLLIWAVAFAGSFVVFYITEPEGTSFARGWNRTVEFLSWQAVATTVAFICLFFRWSSDDELVRRLALIPSIAIGVCLLLVVGVIVYFGILIESV